MIKEKILICGIVKDVEKTIEKSIKKAIKTGKNFQDYRIIVYENNSTDNTKQILQKLKHDKLIIISENITRDEYLENKKKLEAEYSEDSHFFTRIELICFARNKLVAEINKPAYDDFPYVVMIDLDSYIWSIPGILDSLKKKKHWDAVYGNSIPFYYDYFSLRLRCNSMLNFGPEILGQYWWDELENNVVEFRRNFLFTRGFKKTQPRIKICSTDKNNKKRISYEQLPGTRDTEGLVAALSAFNGIGIFKKSIFRKFSYNYLINDDIKEVYRALVGTDAYNRYKLHIEKSGSYEKKMTEKDEKSPIIWKKNLYTLCEHIPLNFALIRRGYKIYINPAMTYGHPSAKNLYWKLIKKFFLLFFSSLKRKKSSKNSGA